MSSTHCSCMHSRRTPCSWHLLWRINSQRPSRHFNCTRRRASGAHCVATYPVARRQASVSKSASSTVRLCGGGDCGCSCRCWLHIVIVISRCCTWHTGDSSGECILTPSLIFASDPVYSHCHGCCRDCTRGDAKCTSRSEKTIQTRFAAFSPLVMIQFKRY